MERKFRNDGFTTFSLLTFECNIYCTWNFSGVMRKLGPFIWHPNSISMDKTQKRSGHTPLINFSFRDNISIYYGLWYSYTQYRKDTNKYGIVLL